MLLRWGSDSEYVEIRCLSGTGGTCEGGHRFGLDVAEDVVEQVMCAARDGDMVSDVLPSERLDVELGRVATPSWSANARTSAPAPPSLPSLPQCCVLLLGAVFF